MAAFSVALLALCFFVRCLEPSPSGFDTACLRGGCTSAFVFRLLSADHRVSFRRFRFPDAA
jgi:hypothetical protein